MDSTIIAALIGIVGVVITAFTTFFITRYNINKKKKDKILQERLEKVVAPIHNILFYQRGLSEAECWIKIDKIFSDNYLSAPKELITVFKEASWIEFVQHVEEQLKDLESELNYGKSKHRTRRNARININGKKIMLCGAIFLSAFCLFLIWIYKDAIFDWEMKRTRNQQEGSGKDAGIEEMKKQIANEDVLAEQIDITDSDEGMTVRVSLDTAVLDNFAEYCDYLTNKVATISGDDINVKLLTVSVIDDDTDILLMQWASYDLVVGDFYYNFLERDREGLAEGEAYNVIENIGVDEFYNVMKEIDLNKLYNVIYNNNFNKLVQRAKSLINRVNDVSEKEWNEFGAFPDGKSSYKDEYEYKTIEIDYYTDDDDFIDLEYSLSTAELTTAWIYISDDKNIENILEIVLSEIPANITVDDMMNLEIDKAISKDGYRIYAYQRDNDIAYDISKDRF